MRKGWLRAFGVVWAMTTVVDFGSAQFVTIPRPIQPVALYPADTRRPMTTRDYARFPGAGVLYCRDGDQVAHKASAAWLIGDRGLVLMNAHNLLDRRGDVERTIDTCFFQIAGRNYEFDPATLRLGTRASAPLHITDDWALARLREPVDGNATPQPFPEAPTLITGTNVVKVTMVSPAGHGNFAGLSSIESCEIRTVDPPSEDGIRRARHDCNDGFGGSGSGLFDEAGHLVAMQSASLDMNRRIPFDPVLHYGSALLIEGQLRDAIARDLDMRP